eukprot:scaffold2780_cov174-Amphora_coffeaeformis.AAC.16
MLSRGRDENAKKVARVRWSVRVLLRVLAAFALFLLMGIFSLHSAVQRTVRKNKMFPPETKEQKARDEIVGKIPLIYPRAFPVWPYDDYPCFPPDPKMARISVQRSPAHQGFLFVKPMKVGGSTAAGVNARIARRLGKKHGYLCCKARWDHSMARTLEYGQRIPSQSFLWTVLREPTRRAVSEFFHFEVSRKQVPPTTEEFQKYVKGLHFYNYYVNELHTRNQTNPIAQKVQEVLQDYDFIGITERMEESIVVLMMLLRLNVEDVVYLSSKTSGSYDALCYYIQPSRVTPETAAFLQSPYWQERVHWDTILYQAANHSLDLTIERLGPARFAQALGKFRSLQASIKKACSGLEVYPCKSDGTKNEASDCIWNDSGCGKTCIAQYLKENGSSE